MYKFPVTLILIFLVSCTVSYKIFGVQNDGASFDDFLEVEGSMEFQEPKEREILQNEQENLIMEIQKKLFELETSNQKLEKDLKRTQNELNKERKEGKYKLKAANVELISKNDENRSKAENFWNSLVKLAKKILSGIFNILMG